MTTLQTPKPTESVAHPQPAVAHAPVISYPLPEYRSSARIAHWQKIAAYCILVLGSIAFLVPFYFVVNASLKTEAEVNAGNVVRPANRPLGRVVQTPKGTHRQDGIFNYRDALGPEKMNFRPALANTVVITVLCVFGQVISCSLVGFGFARFRFRGRSILFMIMLSTMMLPAQVTMIPVFILFRWMGMIDSFWPLIIPAWLASPFFVFMFRQFFAQVPEELVEAARIDGASNWRIYWQLMMPLSGPVIAIVAIYTFLGAWNDFLGPLIYLNSPENRTIALALNSFKTQYGTTDSQLLMAATVVCMLPCIILFFAAQKYFVESVAMTGLKS